MCIRVVLHVCWCLDTLANLLSRTSGLLLPLPQGFFSTLSVGVGEQGERGELRYVCFLLLSFFFFFVLFE